MANQVVHSLREWAPLTDILDKIPARIQKGIFPADLLITCIDVITEFIALGTDAGIVFWYNRSNSEIQKLRTEVSVSISCIKIVSSVEYMIAAGNINGQVSVFQIQKELPPDINLVAPLTKTKPVQRYTIRDLHKSTVRCTEWSKNGMKLFSGDKNGAVVLTEIDYQTHLSKSLEILNESYDIVQLSVYQSYLLVSTLYRSIICQRELNGNWKISQVGKKDRKILGEYGATFLPSDILRIPNIIASRPKIGFWLADLQGNVEKTLTFNESPNLRNTWEIPLLNPSRNLTKMLQNFSIILVYCDKLAITYDDTILYILNLEELKIEAFARGFRQILDVKICGKEIFILEGSRSLIRLAPCPEPPSKRSTIIFNPLLPPPLPQIGTFERPIEYEAEDDNILNAEECFELPPIENLELEIQIQQQSLDSPRTEQNRRIDMFNQISELDFDESILYRSQKKPQKHKNLQLWNSNKEKNKSIKNGIVEIGSVIEEASTSTDARAKNLKNNELETKSFSMDTSFYNGSIIITDPQSPETLQRILEPKEKALAKELHLDRIKLCEIPAEDILKSKQENEQNQPNYNIPLWKPLNYATKMDDAEVQTTPRKKIHFISDDDDDDDNDNEILNCQLPNYNRFSENVKSNYKNINKSSDDEISKQLKFIPTQPVLDSMFDGIRNHESNIMMASGITNTKINTNEIPEIQPVPEHMKVPTIWNLKIGSNESDSAESHTSSEWEFIEDNIK